MEYKVVRIPDWAYENGKRLQGEIIKQGLNSVPREIQEPSLCPQCGTQLEYVELKYRYSQCPNCSYRQQIIGANSNIPKIVAGVGLGVLIGWGIGELIKARKKD